MGLNASIAVALVAATLAALPVSAAAQQRDELVLGERFGAFATVEGEQSALFLDGDIGPMTALEFRRALKARPDVKLLYLHSGGGYVDIALIVAHEVHERAISTYVPAGASCYSACAYIFLAGSARAVAGELGVHQLWNDENDLISGQAMLSDVLEALGEFGTAQSIISIMLRTTPDQIHVFTSADLSAHNINRGDPLAVRAPLEPVGEIAPEPAPLPANLRDLGAENVTVIAKTTSAAQAGLGRSERILAIRDTGPLAETLLKNGFTPQMVGMISATLAEVLPSMTMPKGARLRILFGPSRNSNSLIPYRMSIYFPDAAGKLKHAATAALTDRGSYVLGLAPTEIEFPGEDAAERRPCPATTESPFKQDRLRPIEDKRCNP